MRGAFAGVWLLAGCFDPSFHDPTCGPAGECPSEMTCVAGVCRSMASLDPDAQALTSDGQPDAMVFTTQDADPDLPDGPSPCSLWSYAPANVPCTNPTGPWNVGSTATFNTDTGALTVGTTPASSVVTQMGATQQARVVVVDSLDIPTGITLTVRGTLPLILIVHGTATIAGTLDASANLEVPGPNGNATQCTASGTGIAGSGGSAAGGGGGGGFGGSGGSGGDGNNNTGGNPGTAITGAPATLSPLRGGCAGGKGGDDTAGSGGLGGAGGGALQLSARDAISVSGTVKAGGGGGHGAQPSYSGGGGGGSGGALLLEAPNVNAVSTAKVCANSGAGGEGSGNNAGLVGGDGVCQSAAVGGTGGSTNGGDGGTGTNGSVTNGNNGGNGGSLPVGGGGGGGGGRGIIRVRGTLSNAGLITPTVTNVPL